MRFPLPNAPPRNYGIYEAAQAPALLTPICTRRPAVAWKRSILYIWQSSEYRLLSPLNYMGAALCISVLSSLKFKPPLSSIICLLLLAK